MFAAASANSSSTQAVVVKNLVSRARQANTPGSLPLVYDGNGGTNVAGIARYEVV